MSEQFPPYGGGAEVATYLYAKRLSEADFRVVVVTSSYADKPEVSKSRNLVIYRLPLFKGSSTIKYSILWRFDVLFSDFMRKVMRWADVVYVPRFWFSAIPLAKVYGKPVVVHLHDYIALCPLANFYDLSIDSICHKHGHKMCSKECIYVYERTFGKDLTKTLFSVLLNSTLGCCLGRVVKSSDAIICVSKAQKDIIGGHDTSFREKAHVIYNPLPELSTIEIEGDGFGYFGGPDYLKGYGALCHAAGLLTCQKTHTTRIHATSFPKEEIRALNHSSIAFYKRLNAEEMQKLYRQIKAVIFPSLTAEPLPYTVSEALLRGRVIIASEVGGIPEQVEGCKGAFLFEAGNHHRLAEILEEANSLSKETMTDLGLQNREAFTRNFNNEKTIHDFINLCTAVSHARFGRYIVG